MWKWPKVWFFFQAAEVKDENTTEFKSEIVLNDVDEFCRAVGQANAEKQIQAEKYKADQDAEEIAQRQVLFLMNRMK